VNDETREFYISLNFDNYCADSVTINGGATASGQTDTNAFNQDMYNDKNLAPNPYSITFDPLTISTLGSSFSARGYALVTKTDETDSDADVDATGSEPINPNNTPDVDDDPAADEYPDNGGVTTIKLDILLEDDATKNVYKTQDFSIALTNRVDAAPTDPNCTTYVDANLNGRYFDPNYGYIDLSTPTPLKVCPKEYWPSSGILKAVGAPGAMTTTTTFNSSASLTVTGYRTYQLDVDSSGSGQSESTTTGTWPTP
jgi:hypothetical protein